MLSLAIACFTLGTALIVGASLLDTASRVPGLLRGLERDRQRLRNVTHYHGPTYGRHAL